MGDRKAEINRMCISISVGVFVRRIEAGVRNHTDRGRSVVEEAKAVMRRVIHQHAEEVLHESGVFVIMDEDTPVPPHKEPWGPDKAEVVDTPSPELRDVPE